MEFDELVGALSRFWAEAPPLDQLYRWKVPPFRDLEPVGESKADQVRNMRARLAEIYPGADLPTRTAIAEWVVRTFGGIKGNRSETLAGYVAAKPHELIRNLNGVSSWSKILSIHDPKTYAIYDARVALQLNYLQLAYLGRIGMFFPIPASQSRKLAKLINFLESVPRGASSAIAPEEAYGIYLRALKAVAVGQQCSVEELEMKLFAAAQWRDGAIPFTAGEWQAVDAVEGPANVHWFRGAIGHEDPYNASHRLWEDDVRPNPAMGAQLQASLGEDLTGWTATYALLALANEEYSRLQRQLVTAAARSRLPGARVDEDMQFDQLQQASHRLAAERAVARLRGMRVPTESRWSDAQLEWEFDARPVL